MSYVNREDLYSSMKPEFKERTKTRLTQLEQLGLVEVGVAEFGLPGRMSGLYIERVWHYSDKEWKEYVDWIKTFLD